MKKCKELSFEVTEYYYYCPNCRNLYKPIICYHLPTSPEKFTYDEIQQLINDDRTLALEIRVDYCPVCKEK